RRWAVHLGVSYGEIRTTFRFAVLLVACGARQEDQRGYGLDRGQGRPYLRRDAARHSGLRPDRPAVRRDARTGGREAGGSRVRGERVDCVDWRHEVRAQVEDLGSDVTMVSGAP